MRERPLTADSVQVVESERGAGAAAGQHAAQLLREAIARRGAARVVFASAPSQEAMLRALTTAPDIDWTRVTSLHLDEYRSISSDHPAAFGQWLADRLPIAAQPGLERIGTGGAGQDEIERYSELLRAAPVDLVCLGIGVNGHIAFNEPGDTDFATAALLREVPLTQTSRQQQVDEGLFRELADVPTHALSMTVPAILRGEALVCTVLGAAKASAVVTSLTDSISTAVPATALRTHPQMTMFLDDAAASQLPKDLATTRV